MKEKRAEETLAKAEEEREEGKDNDLLETTSEAILLQALTSYVNLRASSDGMTALHLATAENHAPCVEWLLSLGADPHGRDYLHGETPLHTACRLGHTPIVRLLAPLDAFANGGIGGGVGSGSGDGGGEFEDGIGENGDQQGTSAFYAACVGGHLRCVEILESAAQQALSDLAAASSLLNGNSSNFGDTKSPSSPPSSPSANPSASSSAPKSQEQLAFEVWRHRELDAALLGVCEAGHRSVAEHLLTAGANLNVTNAGGETPIMVASRFGHADLVQFLLHRSCDFVSGRSRRQRLSPR